MPVEAGHAIFLIGAEAQVPTQWPGSHRRSCLADGLLLRLIKPRPDPPKRPAGRRFTARISPPAHSQVTEKTGSMTANRLGASGYLHSGGMSRRGETLVRTSHFAERTLLQGARRAD